MAWALERDDGPLDAVLEVRPALVSVSFGGCRGRTSTGCATRASG